MTSQTPNPSFIIINSLEQENCTLIKFINLKFTSPTLYTFKNLNEFLKSETNIDTQTVCFLFENALKPLDDDHCDKVVEITSKMPTIVLAKKVDYNFSHQLIKLGICEVLLQSKFDAEQMQQSIFLGISRYLEYFDDLQSIIKNKHFDVLNNHYGDLIITVDLSLNFKKASKSAVNRLENDSNTLRLKNLLNYIHPEDSWQLTDISKMFEYRDFLVVHPIRIKTADGSFQNFEIHFFKSQATSEDYIITLKDFTDEKNTENFRRENNERFSAIAEATNSIVYEYFNHPKQLFTADNKGYYGLIENNQLEEYIEHYYKKIHPDDRNRVKDEYNRSATVPSKLPFAIEYRMLKSNGRYKTILDRNRVLFKNGVAFKRVGALTDISNYNAQNSLIAFEKQVYELNADPNNNFCDVIAYLECRMEELIPEAKCMVLTMDSAGKIESVSERDHNNYFIGEIALHSIGSNPLCDKVGHRGKISESERWLHTIEITNEFGFNYYWTSPATNKENETIANVVLLFSKEIEVEEIEEKLVQRITSLVGILVAKNKALSETKNSKERYEIVAKATSDTIWDWNVHTDDFVWNRGINQIFGYESDKVGNTSKWWFSHVHPEDSIRVSVKLYNFLEQKVDKWQDEYRFACADGTYKYVFDRGFLEKDADGKPLRMIGAMQDITRQKKEEERLKLLSAAITQANDAVIITETPRRIYAIPKIVYVNPAFSKMTGYSYDEVVGKPPTIFIGKNAMVEQQTILSKATEFNKEFIFEAINRRKNGEEYWAKFSMIPVADSFDEHSHWISIQSDITEQKTQEKEKEQLIQELTRNNNDLKQFSYITSHNLRAPLSNLIGLLNLTEDIEIEDEDLRDIIEGFSKSTHLLNQTINDLIKIVIIKDNLSIDKESIEIQTIIQNILDQLSYSISMYSPKININIAKAPYLFVNKSYIESIFLNLITNALRYSSPDRILEIDISSQIIGNETILIFKDNGVGIDLSRNSEKLFGLYQRFHDYPDSKGLGLYLVKSQVLSMGGSITVESELGIGSSFIIRFKNK